MFIFDAAIMVSPFPFSSYFPLTPLSLPSDNTSSSSSRHVRQIARVLFSFFVSPSWPRGQVRKHILCKCTLNQISHSRAKYFYDDFYIIVSVSSLVAPSLLLLADGTCTDVYGIVKVAVYFCVMNLYQFNELVAAIKRV